MPVILPSKLLRRASDALAEGRKAREHAKFSRRLAQADAVEASCVHAEAATRGTW
jgi:hypothetical protein